MNKMQTKLVKVGSKVRSIITGIDHVFQVEEVLETGHRPPYFRIKGMLVSYHDVTFGTFRMERTRRQR